MNILGEALDGLGRRYVAVPPFLIIGFLAALFFLTGAGQERLQEASGRLQRSAERELAIEELQSSIARSAASWTSGVLRRAARAFWYESPPPSSRRGSSNRNRFSRFLQARRDRCIT